MKVVSAPCLLLAGALCAPGIVVAETITAETAAPPGTPYGSWLAKCEQPQPDQQGGCFMIQELVLKDRGQRVLQIAIGYVPGDQAPIAALSLPLGMSLPGGVKMEVEGAPSLHFPVERCEPNGCRAGARLAPEFLDALGRAASMTVRFNDSRREPIAVAVSLAGFGAGLAALKAGPQAAP